LKAASLNQIKKELETISPQKLMALSLRLIKFKTENKELISYLLFDEDDQASYISDIKYEISELLADTKTLPPYMVKRTFRKTLKLISKYSKYMGSKDAEAELLMHFSKTVYQLGISRYTYKAVLSIYLGTLVKIQKILPAVHPDLRVDYENELVALQKI
jgi:hypothetical protein